MKKIIPILVGCILAINTTTLAQKKAVPATNNALYSSNAIATDPCFEPDSLTVSKTNKMLEEAHYWNIIAASLKETSNQEDQELFLVSQLEKLTPEEIIGFRLRTDQLLYDTYNSELWCAAYIINHGCSDGGFEYFRCWLLSRGKKVFYDAKANPDSLLAVLDKEKKEYEFEGFWYVAVNAFKNTTQKELFNFIDYETFTTNDENYPILKFSWNIENPQTMQQICPVLYANLWLQHDK